VKLQVKTGIYIFPRQLVSTTEPMPAGRRY